MSSMKTAAPIVNPINAEWPFGALTGPDDTKMPEWPLYRMAEEETRYGTVVNIYTRVGHKPYVSSLPVHERTLDETRAEAHKRLRGTIEGG